MRLPDVTVGPRKKWPAVLTEPPLIVIETLSPGDSYSDTRSLAREYHAMGIENIWLIDPETRTSEMYRSGSWLEASRLEIQGSPVYLDMREIFATFDEDDGEDQANQ